MDDLDHSIHIAEYDWTSFYEESEECSLLQPSIACPDNLSLSDSEDSESSNLVFSAGEWKTQQCPKVKSDGAERNAARCSIKKESCTKLLAKLIEVATGGEQNDVTAKPNEENVVHVDSEICLVCLSGNSLNTKEVHEKTAEDTETNKLQAEPLHVQSLGVSAETKKGDGDLQTEIDHSSNEPDPLFISQTRINVNEPHATEGALSEDVSSVTSRAEKERWFITVNDSPARQRAPSSSMKKKQRQKKPRKKMCSSKQEKHVEHSLEIKDNDESEGGRDMKGFSRSKQNLVQNPGEGSSSEKHPDLFQTSCEKDKISEKLLIYNSLKEHMAEPTMDTSQHEPGSLTSMSHDTFTLKDPLHVESAESDQLEHGVGFFSTHNYDSNNYSSVAESVGEPLYQLTENQQLFLTSSHLLNTGHTKDNKVHSCDSALSGNTGEFTINCNGDGFDSTGVEPILTFPSAGETANKMPDDTSTCENSTHSAELCMSSDTPRLQKQDINLSASGSSSGHQLSPLPVPALTLTSCTSVANSSETYAEAAGHTRPVYAISAFWDEMEKMTISDILQLRTDRSTLPRETQEALTLNINGPPTWWSSDGGLMDTSDTADSDYFTQPDEYKPDCSSCEFSSSDFEEEYWQLIGASRNPSPDPHDKNKPQTSASPLLSHDELLSTYFEGNETPVPSENIAGQCLEDQESRTSTKLLQPKPIRKSKTVHNIQALNTEDVTVQSLFGNNESSVYLSYSQSLEENMALKVNDSLETLIPTSILSSTDTLDKHYQISIPEVFEYFFTEDGAKTDSRCITVYDPEDILVAPVFDCTLSTFRDEMSLSPLHDSECVKEKPIPIFSCSHPTVREFTFPKPDYVFLHADYEENDISPIRVVSHSFTQASDCGTGKSCSWKRLLSIRKVCFHNKGSIWCRSSGAWVFPVKEEKAPKNRKDPPFTERRVSSTPTQMFRDLALQQRIWETIHTTRREGIFSTLKQSDICLVCIAFASWVLRSSDPEAADAWKAALLANVSALSAIQFLRQYVKKNPLQDDP